MAIFSRMPAAAVLDPTLPDAARNVLSVICIFADEYGQAWPSVPTIASGAGCSDRTVQRMLKIIENRGHITIRRAKQGKGWSSNFYQVHYPEVDVLRVVTSRMTPPMPQTGDVHAVTTRQDPPAPTSPGVVTDCAGVVTPKVAYEQPSTNISREQPTRDAAHLSDLKLRAEAFSQSAKVRQRAELDRLAELNAEQLAKRNSSQ